MDPVSLGLAGLGVPGQIFSTGVMAYTTISQIQGMGKMFVRYYSQFKIQESRYIFWGTYHKACRPGGLDESQIPRVVFERVLYTLTEIKSILQDRELLTSKYGLQEAGPMDTAAGDLIKRKVALRLRIQALVSMLRAKPRSGSFRVLECVGFFEDISEPQFGITYRLPQGYNPFEHPTPKSLHEIIEANKSTLPYLGDRFRCAYHLAESIHALHSTGWLHKSVCARNILFFPPQNKVTEYGLEHLVSLENPFFAGFALSRPDDQEETLSLNLSGSLAEEMGLYRHPLFKRTRNYRGIFDVYALGMVLIELGTWRTLIHWFPPPSKSCPEARSSYG